MPRTLMTAPAALVALATLFAQPSPAAERTVVLEHFTNFR